MRRTGFLAVGFAGVCLLGGCGGGEEERYTLVPVKGKILLDGKPLGGVTVSFMPNTSNKPPTDGGDITGTDGTFSAKYRNRSGLAPGKYKVVVSQPGSGPGGAGRLPSESTASPYMAKLATESAAKGSGPKSAPWRYGNADSTPLEHDVSSKGDTDLEFDLKSSK